MINCCNKIGCVSNEIPTVFSDCMSYYETLCVLVKKVDGLEALFYSVLTDKMDSYINEHFNELMFDAMYDNVAEKLILSINEE